MAMALPMSTSRLWWLSTRRRLRKPPSRRSSRPARYGALDIRSGRVERFLEKPAGDGQWINGGFFVCETSVLDRIEGDAMPWEAAPLEGLARDGQLSVYMHPGFWAAMDTLRDKRHLEDLWEKGRAPWKVWG